MLTCREVSRLVSKSLDAPLTPIERLGLRFHMVLCRACSRYRRQMRQFHELLRKAAALPIDSDELPGYSLPAEERERLKRLVSAASGGQG